MPKRKKKKKVKTFKAKLHPSKAKVGLLLSEKLKDRATNSEKMLYNALKENGIKFEFQKPVGSRKRLFILDFHIPMACHNLCVECDGGYHNTKKQQKKDK